MEKETAVEWLFKQLWEEPKDKFTWNAILIKANKMFEHEIVDAYQQGYNNAYFNNPLSKEEYYNDTFKNKEI